MILSNGIYLTSKSRHVIVILNDFFTQLSLFAELRISLIADDIISVKHHASMREHLGLTINLLNQIKSNI